jgi:predicted DNA-binding transcriptional regulator AlpA
MDTIDPGITRRFSGDDGTSSLVPARKVQDRYDIADRTLDRWLINPALNFPKPVIINKRRYWRVSELVAWERQRAAGRVCANV